MNLKERLEQEEKILKDITEELGAIEKKKGELLNQGVETKGIIRLLKEIVEAEPKTKE